MKIEDAASLAAAFSHMEKKDMVDFLNTITQLILNILGYLLLDSSRVLISFSLVIFAFKYFKYMAGG